MSTAEILIQISAQLEPVSALYDACRLLYVLQGLTLGVLIFIAMRQK